MENRRSWLWLILVPVGLIAAAIGLLVSSMAGQVMYADSQAVPWSADSNLEPQWAAMAARTRRILQESMAEQNLPGLSVAVSSGGNLVWAEGFGWADIEAHVPVTPQTRFRIGTASTVLTSAGVGVLLEKGQLTLDKEIQTYVPQYPKKQRPVTLRQLMAGVGGVGTDSADDGPLFRNRCEQPVEAVQHFAQDAQLFAPGTQYKHSNYGWVLVSAAVEAAADAPFLRFMREQVFEPLGMDHTGAESATEENPEAIGEPAEDAPFLTFIRDLILQPLGLGRVQTKSATEPATIYARGFGYDPQLGAGVHVVRLRNLSCYAGSMAFFSTPSDLVRFGLAMDGAKLLQPETVSLLQTSHQLASGRDTGHGLGWEIETVTLAGGPAQAVVREGELVGMKVASLLMFRETGMIVSVMSNSSHADTSALALQVAESFAGPARQ